MTESAANAVELGRAITSSPQPVFRVGAPLRSLVSLPSPTADMGQKVARSAAHGQRLLFGGLRPFSLAT
jgi:hypothetical protein